MTEAEFLENLPAWTDGELDDATAARMEAYVNANPQAAELADCQREFDACVRNALMAGVEADETIQQMLIESRPGDEISFAKAPPRPARMLLFVRASVAAAAALLMAFSMGWFYCVGPFECPMIEALEHAAEAEPVVAEATGDIPLFHPPGGVPKCAPDMVAVEYPAAAAPALRARYAVQGHDVTVLWAHFGQHTPSTRRKVTRNGVDWWVAEENGHHLVAFRDGDRERLVCLVADVPEVELLGIADDLRRQVE